MKPRIGSISSGLAAALLAWVAATPSPAEDQTRIPFARLGMEDGLSQAAVTVILQDHVGFMWVGT